MSPHTGLIHAESGLKMDTFVLQALVAGEIRDGAKAFEPRASMTTSIDLFIFHLVTRANNSSHFPFATCDSPPVFFEPGL